MEMDCKGLALASAREDGRVSGGEQQKSPTIAGRAAEAEAYANLSKLCVFLARGYYLSSSRAKGSNYVEIRRLILQRGD
jgi:hypothetical protein